MVEPFRNVTEFTLHTGAPKGSAHPEIQPNSGKGCHIRKQKNCIYLHVPIYCLPWHTFTGGGEGEGEGEGERDLSDIELSLGVLFRPSLLFLGGEGSARD